MSIKYFSPLLPLLLAAPLCQAEPSPSSPAFQGFYAGSVYGVGIGQFSSHTTASRSFSKAGQTGGGVLGYNGRSGNFVYGLEGDLTLHVVRGENQGVVPGLAPHNVDTLYTSRLRGRVGYAVNDFLPFLAGGVAFNETYVSKNTDDIAQTRRLTGWTLGAGVDWRVQLPLVGFSMLRLEYVYDHLPQRSYAVSLDPISVRPSLHSIRIGFFAIDKHEKPTISQTQEPVDWSGAYMGVMGGGFWAQARTTTTGYAAQTPHVSGPVFGLYTGRNFVFWQNAVIGLESAATLAHATGSSPLPGFSSPSSLHYRGYIQADTRVRLGYAFHNILPFVAVGVSFGRSEQRDPSTGSDRGRIPTETWTIGAGFDYRLSQLFSARIEYLYENDFKTRKFSLNNTLYEQKRSGSTLRLGLAYHFQ